MKRVIPPLGNETITLLKDTSLVYILAMNDLMRVTRAFVQRDFDTMPFPLWQPFSTSYAPRS